MKHPDLVAKMTLEEKADYVSGGGYWCTKAIPRLGVPAIALTDGPHGLRTQADKVGNIDFSRVAPSTAFPTASLSACSFDPALLREMGEALARECRKEKVAIILGPGANLKRSPLCGRNFEYFSEDPLLSASLAAAWIRGVESGGVGTSLKHYAVNSQEKRRMSVDEIVEPRALRELYLACFEGAVRDGRPSTLMCSYNKVNGEYASESAFLQTEVLRGEWGFEGFVMTDWGATNDRARGLRAGVDLEMPSSGPANASLLAAAVREGRLDEAELDRAVDRILDFVLARSPDAPEGAAAAGRAEGAALPPARAFTAEEHHALARRVGRESMVLLRNEEGILPLSRTARVAVVGELARSPRYQGAGSSFLNPSRLASFLDALGDNDVPFDFSPGYRADTDRADPALERSAIALARDTAERGGRLVVFLGLTDAYESEGFDREHLRLPGNQTALLERLAAACPDIVAVFVGGSPVETPWIGSVKALLAGYLGGQASGEAQFDLLFGLANPSGKLAETWPISLADTPTAGNFPGQGRKALHKEGLFVGYRHYASAGLPVRFPFGHGLSYTDFALDALELSALSFRPGDRVTARLRVRNTGKRTGKEVVQAYVSFPASRLERPALALAAFAKVELGPGEEARVELSLDDRAFRHWEEELGRFALEDGPVLIRVGNSSAKLPLAAELRIEGGIEAGPPLLRRDLSRPHAELSDGDFSRLLGRPLPPDRPARPHDLESSLAELAADSALARLVLSQVVKRQTSDSRAAKGTPNYRMLEEMMGEMPISRLVSLSAGEFKEGTARALIDHANGKKLGGIIAFVKSLGGG